MEKEKEKTCQYIDKDIQPYKKGIAIVPIFEPRYQNKSFIACLKDQDICHLLVHFSLEQGTKQDQKLLRICERICHVVLEHLALSSEHCALKLRFPAVD